MARIIVFHYSEEARVPQLSDAQKKEIREKYDSVIATYPGVIFHGVSVDSSGQGICEWEAPDVETVNKIVTQVDGHPPVNGAVVVEKIL